MTKFTIFAETNTSKKLADLTNEEIYLQLLNYVKKSGTTKPKNTGKRKVYSISQAEFLIGKLLSNNLINLGVYKDIQAELASWLVNHWLKLKTLNQNHH